MTTDFPTAPSAYGLNGPSANVTVEKSIHASHTEILPPPHIVDATQESFNFLGFTIQMSRGASTGKPYPNVRPADKSLKKIKARLTELTPRQLTAIPLGDIVGSVNRSLRGWANYFHYRNSSLAMSKVRNHAEDRLRTHLMKRHKGKDRGTGLRRFPSADLYGRYGLYKVPAVAGWRSVHASA